MSWHLIVVEGRERDLRAFVAGFLADRHADPVSVIFGDDVGLERESVHERLRALLHGGHHALFVPDDLAPALGAALESGAQGIALRVIDRHPIAEVSFQVTGEVYSRDVATEIRQALRDAPLSQHSEQEEEHVEDKGVELYAPTHDYMYRVGATVTGPLANVLTVRRRLRDIEAVTISRLRVS